MVKEKLQCTDCRYKFAPKGNEGIPEVCPYCGKQGSVDKVESAEDLLRKYGD